MTKKKKILYIKAQGLGDMISGIPFLVEMKEQGHEVRQIFYDMNTLVYLYDLRKLFSSQYRKALKNFKQTPMSQGWYHILEKLREQGLIKGIVYIPFGILAILRTIIKYRNEFDEVIVTIKTRPAKYIGMLLGKKITYIFTDTNDISTNRIVSDGELGKPALPLYSYKNYLPLPLESVELPEKYIVVFPSIFERCLLLERWTEIFQFITSQGFNIVILGGSRENRFVDEIQSLMSKFNIVNLINRTSFSQMLYVLSNSQVNILCNGGVMRAGNLVNKHNINIHTVSAFLMEPPVDDQKSFNVRPYDYPLCRPCETAESTAGIDGIPRCVFYNTENEGACRKAIVSIHIISILKKYSLLED